MAVMWFLQGPCGSSLGTVPVSCGFFTHREPSLGHVLVPRAWAGAGSPEGTLVSPWRPPALHLLGEWGWCFIEETQVQKGTMASPGPHSRRAVPSVHGYWCCPFPV